MNLIRDVLNIVEDFAKAVFLKHIVVKNFFLSVKMTGDDPAELAEKCGKMSAFIYPAMGKISNKMNVKNCKIYISPDFIGEENSAAFNIKLSVRPICLTNAVVVLAFKALIQLVKVAISNNQAAKPKKKIIKKVKKL